MAFASPTAGSALNSPSHSLLHRQFDIDTAAAEQSMVIDSVGKVGIGTTAPEENLHVVDLDTAASTIKIGAGITNNYYGKLEFLGNTTGSGATLGYIPFINKRSGSEVVSATIEAAHFSTGTDDKAYLAFGTHDGSSLVERMRITQGGNVGIGTASPTRLLDVSSTTNSNIAITSAIDGQSSLWFADTDINIGGILYTHTNNQMEFRVNDASRMTIDSSGNVGIGTTSPGAQLNLAKIVTTDVTYTGIKIDYDIQTPAADSHGLRIGSDINMGMSDGRDLHADIIGESVVINTAGSDTTSHTGSPVGVDITITNNAASDNDAYGLRINAGTPSTGNNYAIYSANTGDSYFAGNVGVGTTNPSSQFQVGPESTTDNSQNASMASWLYENEGGVTLNRFESNGFRLASNFAGNFYLGANSTTSITLENGGNVGIGTTSPSSKLDVVGDIELSNDLLLSTGAVMKWNTTDVLLTHSANTLTMTGATEFKIDSLGGGYTNIETNAITLQRDNSGHLLIFLNEATVFNDAEPLGYLRWNGNFNGAGEVVGAEIRVEADGAWTSNTDTPTKMIFQTTPSGSATKADALVIGNDKTANFEGPLLIKEQATANADVAGYGQIWVKNDTPNTIWFTDDAGTDTQLGTGSGSSTIDVAQTAHGLAVGDVIKSSGTDGEYAKAQADSAANSEVVGIVTEVADVNNFVATLSGPIAVAAAVPAVAAGTVLFLDPSTAGALTSTEPTTIGQISKPLAIVTDNADTMVFFNMRGAIISDDDVPTATYITSLLGTEATGDDNKTFTLTAGTFSNAKYLDVYLNGVLQEEGASNDYVATGTTQAVFNAVVEDTDKIIMKVRSSISSQMDNPMTTGGDIIYGGASGVPTRLANGTDGQVLTSTGTTTAPAWEDASSGGFTSKARATKSTQTISNTTFTKIAFNAETYDVDSEFDSTTNNRFVATTTGYYLVVGNILWNSSVDQSAHLMRIYRNGSSVSSSNIKSSGTSSFTQRISDVVYLTATQYIELFVYQNTGGDVNISGDTTENFITIHRLS